jgi:hypothetical protein
LKTFVCLWIRLLAFFLNLIFNKFSRYLDDKERDPVYWSLF